MRKNNKGFTMIEILGAIVIMGVLLMLVVPSVSRMLKGFREDYYAELEQSVVTSAKDFYTDNKLYKPNGLLKSSYTKLSSLTDKDYIDSIDDYKGKSCSLEESYVIVIYRGGDNYEYHTCLKCAGDDYQSKTDGTYCDPAWKTNDNIEYTFGNNDDIYIYYKTPKEEVREKLLNNINIVKYNKKGVVLDKVSLAEANINDVLPENIDELDTTVLDDDNKKNTTLRYRVLNEIKDINVIVYKHKEPKVEMKNGKGNNYSYGTWTNKLIITLEKNDDFFEKTNTSIGHFQVSINNGAWENVVCEMKSEYTCSFTIAKNVNANYKFRIETNEGKISDETSNYRLKVDIDKPIVSINPNGAEPIISVGSTTGNISFILTTSDTGGSDIKSRKYAITTSTQSPEEFVYFTTNPFNYSELKTGNTYYVWARVEDNAGNISDGVWPSNVFHMKYEVIYDANGGIGAPNKTYKKYGENLTISATTPTRAGYTFKGWSTSANGSVVYKSGDTYTQEEAVRLYAVWEANEYTVTFDAQGGNVTPSNKKVTYNNTYGDLPTPTRTGYAFNGWYTSSSGGTRIYDSTTVTTIGNHTLYARWTANSLTIYYYSNYATTSFSGAANTVGSSKNILVRTVTEYYDATCESGLWDYSTSGSSTYLARTGYTATGNWGTSTSGGYVVNQGTSYAKCQDLATALGKDLSNGSATVNIYPQWSENVLTVNYYSNYATSSFSGAANTVSASTNVLVRTTTHKYTESQPDGLWNYSTSGASTYLGRTGYTATGNWGTSTSGGTLVGENTSFATGQALAQALGQDLSNGNASVNIYAQWTINSYTVTYNANGGSVSPTSASANYGSNVTLPTPTRSGGYTFNGWYTASSGGTKKGGAGASYKVEANITLYAQWSAPAVPTHNCSDNTSTRTKNSFSEIDSAYIIKWYGVNEYNHWCTNKTKTSSCIPSNYLGKTTKIPMYKVTCQICGKQIGGKWCPVHGASGNATSGGGGKGYEICDESTKSYSSGATKCIGKTQGWTLVSK